MSNHKLDKRVLTDDELCRIVAAGGAVHTPRTERHDSGSYIPVGGRRPTMDDIKDYPRGRFPR